jgi:hypothetical protein
VEQVPLYLPETARWYALISQAEYETRCQLPVDAEHYLVRMLLRFTKEQENRYVQEDRPEMSGGERQKSYEKLNRLGDQCLLMTGLFPDHQGKYPFPFSHFVETGENAYRELARGRDRQGLFTFLGDNFVLLMDVLQQVRELCDGYQFLDPIQAYDIWQETGSQRALSVLSGMTCSFPVGAMNTRPH